MFLKDGLYVKGVMEWSLDENTWHFSHCHKNGVEIFGVALPIFFHNFQNYIDYGTIIPGWQSGKTFSIAGTNFKILQQLTKLVSSWYIPSGPFLVAPALC